jgi:biopolymer transport protein ExbD
MAFAAANPRDTQMSSMNITPLVDVMLVLLVIFMIAMPAVSQTLPVSMPGKQSGPPVEKTVLHLSIGAGDVYALDGVAMGRGELSRHFVAAMTGASLPVVVEIQASPDAEYDTVAQGLVLARNAGIENLGFVQ